MTRALPRLAVVALFVLAGCGESADDAIRSERDAADLVVGSTASEWGLLTVPRAGGTAELRPVVDPDSVVWTGSTELPVASSAWSLEGKVIVLRAESGAVSRYTPTEDEAERLATLSDQARVTALSPSSIVFLDSAGRFAYEVGPEHEHGYALDEPAVWAGAVDGGLALLIGANPSALRILMRADSAAVAEISDAGRTPALVTAWGRRVVITGPDGRTVRIYSTEAEGALVGEVELAGPVRELGASPSSHEIYALLDDPPRLQRISRFSLEADDPIELESTADGIRPGLFGGSLLVATADGTLRFRTGSRKAVPLPGEWRTDLPLGLPGDLTIVTVEDEARLVSVNDSAGTVLAGGAPHWWLPVHFNPTLRDDADLRQALDELGAEAGAPAGAVPDDVEEAPSDGEVGMPQVGGEAEADPAGPAGFYAIVVSARQREGVDELLATLSEAGYPTRVQTYPDEAGELWYRGLVGPYPSRARAQAAARQLLRERDLQAWVTEIGASE